MDVDLQPQKGGGVQEAPQPSTGENMTERSGQMTTSFKPIIQRSHATQLVPLVMQSLSSEDLRNALVMSMDCDGNLRGIDIHQIPTQNAQKGNPFATT